jgi:hypothetical protein
MPFIAHSNAISAGAAPKETISESESYSAPKRALGPGHARHPAVEPVEHHGDENRYRCMFEAPGHGLDYGVETGKQRRRRQQVGQQIDTAPTQFGVHQRLARGNWRHGGGNCRSNACYSNGSHRFGNTPGFRGLAPLCVGRKQKGRTAAPCLAPPAKSVLGLIDQLVLLDPRHHGRNCSPTCSIGCAAVRRRRAVISG